MVTVLEVELQMAVVLEVELRIAADQRIVEAVHTYSAVPFLVEHSLVDSSLPLMAEHSRYPL